MWRWFVMSAMCVSSSCGDGQSGEAPNSAPTQVLLSVSSVSERAPLGSTVGVLTASDPDPGDVHTFELLNNLEDFAVVSNELRVAGNLDFETRASYGLSIRATDSGGLTRDELIILDLTDELEVSNTNDSGPGSLRELLGSAPSGASVFVESFVRGTITLTTGVISVDRTINLIGPGASTLALSGGDAQAILAVEETGDLTLSGLTLTNSLGSAITNAGSLSLTDAVIRDSTEAMALGRGACLSTFGPLTVARVTFTGCSAYNAGAVDLGGGPASFDSVTFALNETTGNSGGAMIVSSIEDVTITNSTFSGNFTTGADRVAGAIGVFESPGRLVLSHNTFFGNSATGAGGAIFMAEQTRVDLKGNLFAGNSAVSGPDMFVDPLATLTSLGFNLLEDGSGSGLVDGVNGDIVGQPAMVQPLANNGGPTETHTLSPGSVAIDVIPPEECSVTVDQRGEARPVGGGCDLGSVEQ